jgi:hypothetical protein
MILQGHGVLYFQNRTFLRRVFRTRPNPSKKERAHYEAEAIRLFA